MTPTHAFKLVQWNGYGPAYNSWEPGSTLRRNAPETLSAYSSTGMRLKLLLCKQLSLQMALTQGGLLVIKLTLPHQAEVQLVVEAMAEVVQQAEVLPELSDRSANN